MTIETDRQYNQELFHHLYDVPLETLQGRVAVTLGEAYQRFFQNTERSLIQEDYPAAMDNLTYIAWLAEDHALLHTPPSHSAIVPANPSSRSHQLVKLDQSLQSGFGLLERAIAKCPDPHLSREVLSSWFLASQVNPAISSPYLADSWITQLPSPETDPLEYVTGIRDLLLYRVPLDTNLLQSAAEQVTIQLPVAYAADDYQGFGSMIRVLIEMQQQYPDLAYSETIHRQLADLASVWDPADQPGELTKWLLLYFTETHPELLQTTNLLPKTLTSLNAHPIVDTQHAHALKEVEYLRLGCLKALLALHLPDQAFVELSHQTLLYQHMHGCFSLAQYYLEHQQHDRLPTLFSAFARLTDPDSKYDMDHHIESFSRELIQAALELQKMNINRLESPPVITALPYIDQFSTLKKFISVVPDQIQAPTVAALKVALVNALPDEVDLSHVLSLFADEPEEGQSYTLLYHALPILTTLVRLKELEMELEPAVAELPPTQAASIA